VTVNYYENKEVGKGRITSQAGEEAMNSYLSTSTLTGVREQSTT
jgi:hypothetical protein